MNLIRWEKVTRPKDQGGLGLTTLKMKNMALIAKWLWRCRRERSRGWNTLLVDKYGADIWIHPTKIKVNSSSSYLMRSLIYIHADTEIGQWIGDDQFNWKVGNGATIMFWEDRWSIIHDNKPLKDIFANLYSLSNFKLQTLLRVLELWNHDCHADSLWMRGLDNLLELDLGKLTSELSSVSLKCIDDQLIWQPSTGHFSTRKCIQIMQTAPENHTELIWKKIWSSKIPPKVTIFL